MENSIARVGKRCAGCAACALICPRDAIGIQEDADGFFRARVSLDRCVQCGLCRSVCLMCAESESDNKIANGTCYAARSRQEATVLSCTSGGVAHELAKASLQQGRPVVGARYCLERNRVEHGIVHGSEELPGIKGSKYLQSDVAAALQSALQAAREDAGSGFTVFGTPCQIYGLDKVLRIRGVRERFLLVDLLCHGVPSYLLWDQYTAELLRRQKASEIREVAFRDKCIGWRNYVMKVVTDAGTYRQPSEGDWFYRAYFDNVLLAKSCMDCPARMRVSGADIRLGDLWGKRFQGEEKGVSAVILLSEPGQSAFENLDVETLCEVDIRECLQAQSMRRYALEELHDKAVADLLKGFPLRKVIRRYRREFSLPHRCKLAAREATALLPDNWRAKIREAYRRRQGKSQREDSVL